MSWAFSCLQLRKFYDDVQLVTDKKGEHLFIDILELPYTSTETYLDDIGHYGHDLWAIGKIYTYQQQTKPFLHVDGDIFIWDKFHVSLQQAPLVALHPEPDYQYYYIRNLKDAVAQLKYIPECLHLDESEMLTAINAAIIGGNNGEFYKRYTEEAFRFVDRNLDNYKRLTNLRFFNCLFEQLLFYYLAKDKAEIRFYFPAEPSNLYSFCDIPEKNKVIHARSDKRIPYTNEAGLYRMMQMCYPSQYFRIEKVLSRLAV